MKTLQNYITEKILINKNSKIEYIYHPKTKKELKAIRKQSVRIKKDPQPNPVNQDANTNNEGSNTVGQTNNNVSVHEKKKGCC